MTLLPQSTPHNQKPEVIAGRAAVASALAKAKELLPPLAPGARAIVLLPQGNPWNRDAYRRIGALAHRLWGSGKYRLRSGITQVLITRL